MAKARKGEKKVPGIAETKTKPVRLDFHPDLHYKLRIVAAEAGVPMAVYCRELVERSVMEAWAERERKR